MDIQPVIAASTLIVYLCRVSGFILSERQISLKWREILRFMPIAVFSALTVLALVRDPDGLIAKSAALLAAGAVFWRTRRFSVSALAGMGTLWMLAG